MGERTEAQASASEAVAINRELVRTNPGGSNPALAETLLTLSICLKNSVRSQDALAAIEESVEIYKQLYEQHPIFFQPLLAKALDVLRESRQSSSRQNVIGICS